MRANIDVNASVGARYSPPRDLADRKQITLHSASVEDLFSGAVAYTLQTAKNTGSDPFSYTTLLGREISTLTGQTAPPPQAILPTDDNRTHNITGSASLQFPDDWKKGTMLGNILKNAGAFVTFRFASGLPYTLLVPAEDGLTLTTRCGLECTIAEPVNTSTLPWY